MGKVNDAKYKFKFPINPKDYALFTDAISGLQIKVEASTLMTQLFDLEDLGKSCLAYPQVTAVDCETDQLIVLPLQMIQVMLKHEQLLCKLLTDVNYIKINCCDENLSIEIIIYNEFAGEPNEWTATESSSGANVVLNSGNDAHIGSVGIEINESDILLPSQIILTNDTYVLVQDIKELKLHLKNEDTVSRFTLNIRFFKDAVEVATQINITEGNYNFSNTNIGHNEILVPIDASTFTDTSFNKIYIEFEAEVGTEVLTDIFLDNIRLYHSTIAVFGNEAPTVNASSDEIIVFPVTSVVLDAIGNDNDGIIVSYLWQQISGASATIQNANFSTTNVTGLSEGVYVFKVTVTDNEGAIGIDTVIITVNPSETNLAPIADAGIAQLIYTPASTVNLVGSGIDLDGTVDAYAWTKISGDAGASITSPSSASTGVTGLIEDVYVFRLTVTDNEGAQGTSEVTITVEDGTALVAVNIEIDLGDCDNPADWSGADSVWIDDLPSVASGGDFNQQNGSIIYDANDLLTPFNGGDNIYSFRGVSPSFLDNNRTFKVSAVGVISEMNECAINGSQAIAVSYDSGSSFQPDTYKTLTFSILANGYSNNSGSPVAKFKIKSLPTTGELGLQGNPIVVDEEIPLSHINSNFFAFWADDLDGAGAGGDYVTEFTYIIIDEEGVESNLVTMTVTATDTISAIDATFYSILNVTGIDCYSTRCVKVTVPVGQTREVTISKAGTAGYFGSSECGASQVVLADLIETISVTKIYSIGINASTGNGNSSTTITLAVTGGNSLQLQRTHEDPVINC